MNVCYKEKNNKIINQMGGVSVNCTKLTVLTAAAIILEITGLSLFVLGFFPIKPALSGISGPEFFRPPSSDSSIQDENHSGSASSSTQIILSGNVICFALWTGS